MQNLQQLQHHAAPSSSSSTNTCFVFWGGALVVRSACRKAFCKQQLTVPQAFHAQLTDHMCCYVHFELPVGQGEGA